MLKVYLVPWLMTFHFVRDLENLHGGSFSPQTDDKTWQTFLFYFLQHVQELRFSNPPCLTKALWVGVQ